MDSLMRGPASNTIVQPIEIASGIFWLRIEGAWGRPNVYFIRSGSSWSLIDTAWPFWGRRIEAAAETVFGMKTRPASILLTHGHPDHSGSALELSRDWDLPIYMHEDEQPGGKYPSEYLYPIGRFIGPLMRLMPHRTGPSLQEATRAIDLSTGVPGLPD